jgi:glycerol-3-phosphate acyltransferase PlsY
MSIAVAVLCGYLLGSLPIGLIVGRLAGNVDVRDYGSGKTGFTNTLRVLGLKRSLPVFAGDFGKGLAASLLPLLYTDDPWARAAGGLAAVAGHVWPLFAGFRGGRGVLTGAGALAGLDPFAMLLVVPSALAAMLLTRYMSVTSIVACVSAAAIFSLFAALGLHDWAYAVAACAGSVLIIALHRDNVSRLLAGTEPKIGRGGERRAPASPKRGDVAEPSP